MKQSDTGSRFRPPACGAALIAVSLLVASTTLFGAAAAHAIEPPLIDPAALPPDSPPGPAVPMRQMSYCAEVGVLPGTDFRVQPKFLEMLDLPEAWRFGRGGGVTVAVIDTGVSPHPRLTNLVGGGDYVVAGGDGLSDCDARGTLVASLIAAAPTDGQPASAPRQTRKPPSVPTSELPPPPPPAPAPTTVIVQVPSPAPVPPAGPELPPAPDSAAESTPPAEPVAPFDATPSANFHGSAGTDTNVVAAGYSAGQSWVRVNRQPPMAPPAPPTDAFSGVAPDVRLISIRASSAAFGLRNPSPGVDPRRAQDSENVRTMARAIVHAANLGANVINISQVLCMDARDVIDQADLGAAVRYAAVEKNALIVAAAGDVGERNCKQNPVRDPLQPNDPRNWAGVNTVVTPSWFDEFVLTVGAADATGAAMEKSSLAGPWVSIAAPGTDIIGLSSNDDRLVNAVVGQNDSLMLPTGSGYSAAIVSGVAALVRAKFPTLSSFQVRNRLVQTARAPARGVDNRVGYGIVDPVAALTWDVPDGPIAPPDRQSAPLPLPLPAPARNMVPTYVAIVSLGALFLGTTITLVVARRSASRP